MDTQTRFGAVADRIRSVTGMTVWDGPVEAQTYDAPSEYVVLSDTVTSVPARYAYGVVDESTTLQVMVVSRRGPEWARQAATAVRGCLIGWTPDPGHAAPIGPIGSGPTLRDSAGDDTRWSITIVVSTTDRRS